MVSLRYQMLLRYLIIRRNILMQHRNILAQHQNIPVACNILLHRMSLYNLIAVLMRHLGLLLQHNILMGLNNITVTLRRTPNIITIIVKSLMGIIPHLIINRQINYRLSILLIICLMMKFIIIKNKRGTTLSWPINFYTKRQNKCI